MSVYILGEGFFNDSFSLIICLNFSHGKILHSTKFAKGNYRLLHCNRRRRKPDEMVPLMTLKVVGNEMNGGLESCGLNSYWYGTHVIGVCLSFNGGVVF